MTPNDKLELDRLQAKWVAGHWGALTLAFEYCHVLKLVLPDWLHSALGDCIGKAWRVADGQRPGRYASPRGREKMDRTHWERWVAIKLALTAKDMSALPSKRVAKDAGGEIVTIGGKRVARTKGGTATQAEIVKLARSILHRDDRGATDPELIKSFQLVELSKSRGELRFAFEGIVLPKFRAKSKN